MAALFRTTVHVVVGMGETGEEHRKINLSREGWKGVGKTRPKRRRRSERELLLLPLN
jgi:hypothetical protein